MSSALDIEAAFRHLPRDEQDGLLERLEETREDSLKLSGRFKAEGRGRVR